MSGDSNSAKLRDVGESFLSLLLISVMNRTCQSPVTANTVMSAVDSRIAPAVLYCYWTLHAEYLRVEPVKFA